MTRTAIISSVALGLGVLFVVYALIDPATAWWMPKCPFHLLTGYDCPGCGSQRAVHALLHGDVTRALRENALLVCLLPAMAVMGYAELTRRRNPRLYRLTCRPAVIFTILGLVIVWSVVRNIVF